MAGLTNGLISKRPRKRQTTEESQPHNHQQVSDEDKSSASSSHDSDEDTQPQESFADRLKILNLQDGETLTTDPLTTRVPVSSLAQTLVQALNSTDTKLLETCLLQSNKPLIANTIRRIPTALVHNLVEQLIICLNKKKRGAGDGATVSTVRRTKTLIEWVRQLLLIHMSYLLTVSHSLLIGLPLSTSSKNLLLTSHLLSFSFSLFFFLLLNRSHPSFQSSLRYIVRFKSD